MEINWEGQKAAQNLIISNQIVDWPAHLKLQNQRENNSNDEITEQSMSRQDILSEYSNKFKSSMQFQFRNSFASAGSFQPTHNLPTITYIGSF